MINLRCVIDYESRSKVDLKSSGATKYARHTSTSIICVGWKVNDEPRMIWLPHKGPMPERLYQAFKHGKLVAQNAGFDRAITKWTLPRSPFLTPAQKLTLEQIPASQWSCTAARAAALSYPRALENICYVAGIDTPKDMEGNRLMKKYMKPRKPSKHNPDIWWNDSKELRRIYSYCLTDIQATYELDQVLPELTEEEQATWVLNEKINSRGIRLDIPTIKLILQMMAEEKDHINREVQKLTGGRITSATQTAKVLDWLNAKGLPIKNLKAATLRDSLEGDYGELSPKMKLMLEYREALSKTSTSKYLSMLKAVDEDERARDLLVYSGATPTARFTGTRVQPHNFPRPKPVLVKNGFTSNEAIDLIIKGGLPAIRKKYGVTRVMDVLASCVRGMLVPSKGCEFFCADWAAIEARLAFWFAEHEEGVEAFRLGKKLYEEMAAEIFNEDLEWLCSKEGKDSLERFIGKESILGCQYGLGWQKFMTQCHAKGMKEVTAKIAKKAVTAYRAKHWPVPEAWKNLEKVAIKAIQRPGQKFKTNKVTIWCDADREFLRIKIPSGRVMKYSRPSVVQKRTSWGKLVPSIRYWAWDWGLNPETGKPKKMWTRTAIWGGILFNHIVQGTARDLMCMGIKAIEAGGYKFLLSVHDEGLAERKKGEGNLKEFIELMTVGMREPWMKGAPLRAEGWQGMRYKK